MHLLQKVEKKGLKTVCICPLLCKKDTSKYKWLQSKVLY